MTNFSDEFAAKILKQNQLNSQSDLNSILNNNLLRIFFSRYLIGLNAKTSNMTDNDRKRLGFSLKEMLISCVYNLEYCDEGDFDWFFDATLYRTKTCYKAW